MDWATNMKQLKSSKEMKYKQYGISDSKVLLTWTSVIQFNIYMSYIEMQYAQDCNFTQCSDIKLCSVNILSDRK